jgi:hypothetical protein
MLSLKSVYYYWHAPLFIVYYYVSFILLTLLEREKEICHNFLGKEEEIKIKTE